MAFNLFKKNEDKKKKPAQAEALESVDVKEETKETTTEVSVAPAVPMLGKSVIKYFHVSEKASQGESMSKYTFVVEPYATKNEIAKEVATRYKVDVTSVNIIRLRGKKRRLGRFTGTTNSKKKAIVSLKKGQTIATA